MKLVTIEPIDAIELQWAQEARSAAFGIDRIAEASGRSAEAWEAALAAGAAPFPSNFIIHARFAVVAAAVIAKRSVAETAVLARAPRAWCDAAMRRLSEPARVYERPTPALTQRSRARLAPPALRTEGRRP